MNTDERPSKKRKLSMDQSTTGIVNGTHSSPDLKVSDAIEGDEVDANAAKAKVDGLNDQLDDPVPAGDETDLPHPLTTAPFASTLDANHPPLSKNQQKKLRKKAEWESKREDRKALRKEKATAKRSRRREERQAQEAETIAQGLPLPPPRKARQQRPVTLPVTILIDCNFDDLMRDNERTSLASQITRSYSDNKNALFRTHLAICSFGGKLKWRFENVLGHFRLWRGIRFVEEGFTEAAEMAKVWMREDRDAGVLKGAFSQFGGEEGMADEASREKLEAESEVVYLSSESPDTLETLKPYSTYIIGGLVDKNREKGICYKRAKAAGVKTARLPIGEFMDMQSRKVLATNHVNEIMIRWLECGDWGEAFLKVIPKRKGGKLKEAEADDGRSEGDMETGLAAEEEDKDAHEDADDRVDDVTEDNEEADANVGDAEQANAGEAADVFPETSQNSA